MYLIERVTCAVFVACSGIWGFGMFICSSTVVGQDNVCNRCGYVWDLNDDDPPTCKSDDDIQLERNQRGINALREGLKDV